MKRTVLLFAMLAGSAYGQVVNPPTGGGSITSVGACSGPTCSLSQIGAAPAPAISTTGLLHLYEPWSQTITTTLTDFSGNSNTGTLGTSAAAPTVTASGDGLLFQGSQNVSIPAGAMSGAQTLMFCLKMTTPGPSDHVNSSYVMLSDSASNLIGTFASYNGQMFLTHNTDLAQRGVDRYIGPSCATYVVNGATVTQYINGRLVSGQLPPVPTPSNIVFNGSTAGMIGDLVTFAGNGLGGNFVYYGSAAWSGQLTAAQVAANYQAFATLAQAAKGIAFQTYIPSGVYVPQGDSRMVNFFDNYSLTDSIPYQVFHRMGVDQFTPLGVGGQTQATILAGQVTREYPLLDGSNGPKVFWNQAGTNDIIAGTTAANIQTSLQTWCSNIHTRSPGAYALVSTINPRGDASTAQNTVRKNLNTALVTAWLAGGWSCDGLVNENGNPVSATQVAPNDYSTTSTVNTTYYAADKIHYTAALDTIIANTDYCSVLAGMGQLTAPCWMSIPIPFVVLNSAGVGTTTTVTLPLVQLGPGWQICGLKSAVTTAFAGTSITALTFTGGDSTGTATQYLSSQSLLTTTSAINQSPNFVSNKGIVQGVFTATGGNLSALTAGNLNLEVCVVSIP